MMTNKTIGGWMMIKAVIVGFGNTGKGVYDAIQAAPDMTLSAVVLRDGTKAAEKGVPQGVLVIEDTPKGLAELGKADVALLCVPSRTMPEEAVKWLARGVNTIDSYDLHGNAMADLYDNLNKISRENNAVAVIGTGMDPGVDSMMRGIFELCTPRGMTYTNFGPGMSMGHTVAVKAINGVKDALSLTIPLGTGLHRRMVYIELATGHDFGEVAAAIKADAYFIKDETHVMQVENVSILQDAGHGVYMVRKGVSGKTDNQLLTFDMRVNNPALTGQVMVAAARASCKQKPGCYTMLDIPVKDFLVDEHAALLKRMV
jgi:diaminopimelate dehydrogenase